MSMSEPAQGRGADPDVCRDDRKDLRTCVDGTAHARPPSESTMIQGLVRSNDVLWHCGAILRNYGIRRYLRCLRALFSRRHTTFLEIIWGE